MICLKVKFIKTTVSSGLKTLGVDFFVDGIYCLTNEFPCCTNGEGSWYYPDDSQLDAFIEGSFYQCNSSR